MKHGANICVST